MSNCTSNSFSFFMILSILFGSVCTVYTSEQDDGFVRPAPKQPQQKIVHVLYSNFGRKLMGEVHDTGSRIPCSRKDLDTLLHGPVGASNGLLARLMPRKSIAASKKTPEKIPLRKTIDLTRKNPLQGRKQRSICKPVDFFEPSFISEKSCLQRANEKSIEHTNPVKHPGYAALQRSYQESLVDVDNKRRRVQEKIESYTDPTLHHAYDALQGKH